MKIDYDQFEEKEVSATHRTMKNRKKIKSHGEDKTHRVLGRVVFITPEALHVRHHGKTYLCSLKGTLKKQLKEVGNRITCGDFVHIDPKKNLILSLKERTTYLLRQNPSHKFKQQILASNVNQLLITVSILEPALNPYLIDLYLIAAQKAKLDPVIIINKIDLLEESSNIKLIKEEKHLIKDLDEQYRALNIPILQVSAYTKEGFEKLVDIMKDKASVFSGASGVGKSSLINALEETSLKVAPISSKAKRGTHTTTSSQLLELKNGGWCVDTPGVQSFGFQDLNKDEVKRYFSEFNLLNCRYSDCNHQNEEGCDLKNAIEKKVVSSLRFKSYNRILSEINPSKK